ncbi:MAG: hypothetical protein H7096_11855 [Flavobacterium sp.]|nr:hypothetical protein [Pedobacter sp.]
MRKLLFFLIIVLFSAKAFSQYNFRRFSIGLGGGPNRPFSDVYTNKTGITATIYSDFYFTPFVVGGLETQIGSLKGGNRVLDPHLREFQNSYKTVLFTGKISLGQLLNYNRRSFANTIKGVYVGTGAGFIYNKMKFVTRIKPDGQNNYTFPGKDSGINMVIPATAGIGFNIDDAWDETRYIISVGYQMNLTFGEGMDGFNDPPSIFENNYNDMYSYATISVKYCYGRKAAFYRPFRYK